MRLVPHTRRDHKIDWLGRRADGHQRRVACCLRCPSGVRRAGSGARHGSSVCSWRSRCSPSRSSPPRAGPPSRSCRCTCSGSVRSRSPTWPRSSSASRCSARSSIVPLYLQIVKGATPTQSGLLMLPMMVGVIGTSIVSGRMISRIGRYKWFPVAGTGLMGAGLLLFTQLQVNTPLWQAFIYMLIVGIGLGSAMQPLVLAVQNDLDAQGHGCRYGRVDVLPLARWRGRRGGARRGPVEQARQPRRRWWLGVDQRPGRRSTRCRPPRGKPSASCSSVRCTRSSWWLAWSRCSRSLLTLALAGPCAQGRGAGAGRGRRSRSSRDEDDELAAADMEAQAATMI